MTSDDVLARARHVARFHRNSTNLSDTITTVNDNDGPASLTADDLDWMADEIERLTGEREKAIAASHDNYRQRNDDGSCNCTTCNKDMTKEQVVEALLNESLGTQFQLHDAIADRDRYRDALAKTQPTYHRPPGDAHGYDVHGVRRR